MGSSADTPRRSNETCRTIQEPKIMSNSCGNAFRDGSLHVEIVQRPSLSKCYNMCYVLCKQSSYCKTINLLQKVKYV